MASQDPSLARRLLPAIALTGAGLSLVNVLDHPSSTSAAGAANQSGTGVGGASNSDGAVAAGNTVPGITTVPSTNSTVGVSGNSGSTNSGSGNASTQTPSIQTPATAVPSTDSCGAKSSNGSQESISIRGRSYGTVVVSAKFTSNGALCKVSASYNVYDLRSSRYEDYAIPRLNQQAVAANSANINGVSGATAISNAYARSLQSAIDSK